jgi:DNA-directed RNA polymerase specialized sigma24 family protein
MTYGYAERIVEMSLGAANLYEKTKHKGYHIKTTELREIAEWYKLKVEQHRQKYDGNSVSREEGWNIIRVSNFVFAKIYDMVEDGTDLASGFEARRAGEIINSVLATVGRTNKDIFILRYWLGLSLAQIAAQTGYGESKIKVSLHRTRKKIAAELKKEGITK